MSYVATTNQFPKSPTDMDFIHTPKISIISDNEIEIDISNFYSEKNNQKEDHYIKTITLYSVRRIVDSITLQPGNKVYKAVFNLDAVNKKDRELCEINEWTPRNWKITDKYHAIVTCNIHGNWSDVASGCM